MLPIGRDRSRRGSRRVVASPERPWRGGRGDVGARCTGDDFPRLRRDRSRGSRRATDRHPGRRLRVDRRTWATGIAWANGGTAALWSWPSWAPSARWRSCTPRGWPSWPASSSRGESPSSASRPTGAIPPRPSPGSRRRMTCGSRCSGTSAARPPLSSAPGGRRKSSCWTTGGGSAIAAGSTTSMPSARGGPGRGATTFAMPSRTSWPAGPCAGPRPRRSVARSIRPPHRRCRPR